MRVLPGEVGGLRGVWGASRPLPPQLLVWNHSSLSPVQQYTEHLAAVKAIAWSPHQHGLLASGGGTADRCIRFWNTLTGQPLQCIDTGSQVCNLAWSKHANELVSVGLGRACGAGVHASHLIARKPSESLREELAAEEPGHAGGGRRRSPGRVEASPGVLRGSQAPTPGAHQRGSQSSQALDGSGSVRPSARAQGSRAVTCGLCALPAEPKRVPGWVHRIACV